MPVGIVTRSVSKEPSGRELRTPVRENFPKETDWVGLTCAACHTAAIEFHGRTLLIDGGPAMAEIAFVSNDAGLSRDRSTAGRISSAGSFTSGPGGASLSFNPPRQPVPDRCRLMA